MNEPFWIDLIKQDDLEAQYEMLCVSGSYTDKEIAVFLARFAETRIFTAADKRITELETQLRDQSLVTLSIQGLAYNALRTDGAHHKQWFLEQILQLVSKPEEYERVADEWKAGIEP